MSKGSGPIIYSTLLTLGLETYDGTLDTTRSDVEADFDGKLRATIAPSGTKEAQKTEKTDIGGFGSGFDFCDDVNATSQRPK